MMHGSEAEIEDFVKSSPKKVPTFVQLKNSHKSQSKPKSDKAAKAKAELTSSEESSGGDVELQMTEQSFATDELEGFGDDIMRSPRRQRGMKRNPKSGGGKVKPVAEDCEWERIRNRLYTACKTGNVECVRALLEPLNIVNCCSTQNNVIEETSSASKDADNQLLIIDGNHAPVKHYLIDVKNSESDQLASNNVECNIDKSERSVFNTNPAAVIPTNVASESSSHGKKDLITLEMLNRRFGDDLTTFLHIAGDQGHGKVIQLLLEHGADPALLNKRGISAYQICSSKNARNEFRKFMASHPDKYDYDTAKIPGPLTAEMEAEKKEKEAVRRKAIKKAKKEREKEQKVLQQKQTEEEKERQRYLALSEREKRALAAERRLVNNCQQQNAPTPVLSRCWQCGCDMTGKIPFEYFDYKFCTPACLKTHKLSKKSGT